MPTERTEQQLCVDTAASSVNFRIRVRLDGGSYAQTVVLRLQRFLAGAWRTASGSGLSYETQTTRDAQGIHRRIEHESRSRISLPVDAQLLDLSAALGVPVRIRATSWTTGVWRSARSQITTRVGFANWPG